MAHFSLGRHFPVPTFAFVCRPVGVSPVGVGTGYHVIMSSAMSSCQDVYISMPPLTNRCRGMG